MKNANGKYFCFVKLVKRSVCVCVRAHVCVCVCVFDLEFSCGAYFLWLFAKS